MRPYQTKLHDAKFANRNKCMSKNLDQNQNPHVETDAPPDRAAAGDVSTTGHSSHDVDDAHGGHGDDTSDVPTLVPTTLSQLVLPAIILIIVAILVAGPVVNAFSPKPATSPPTEQQQGANEAAPGTGSSASPTDVPTSGTEPSATQSPTSGVSMTFPLVATQTAVAMAGDQGDVARIPVKLEFGGATFTVKQGSGLLPDWTPNQDTGTATWIEGTVANHILYIPYTEDNAALFKASRPGDIIKLDMNTGQVFDFGVNLAQRAANGPTTKEGQFTVNAAMSQDHAGVTLFLIGDPATDRAVVQADFTGNIQ